MNSIVVVVALCVFWYGDIVVTALEPDTEDIGDPDPLSMPLITDKGAPLVAMLDTKSINRKMKIYIQTLMRNTVKNYEKEQTQRSFETLLEGNSTVEFFRNITLQEINDVLKEKGQDQLINPVRNEGESKQDCADIVKSNRKAKSGVYFIFPDKKTAVRVYCNMNTVHDAWTIIQRRLDGTENFQRTWKDYENGFGNPYGEYWIGENSTRLSHSNKHIHILTSRGRYELRIYLTDLSNTEKYAVYKTFIVGDAASKYKLTVGNYSGNAGDYMAYNNGNKFSTKDQDNDDFLGAAWAMAYGPWWHKSCCYSSLNRKFNHNLYWKSFSDHSAKTSVMMIRKLL
ncbi:fibrinogen-like protein A isoform X1 [Mytilus galloprovincialis]|uniref:fibrinogen-like protein A isoform X1 n=1 Tax=Mytilus galloprovincialis TaxID=29158 RepID=UPI003F7CC7FF